MKSFTMRRTTACIFGLIVTSCQGFQLGRPLSIPARQASSNRRLPSLKALGPEHAQLFQDLQHAADFSPAFAFLSDAAVDAAKQDEGWWQAWLNIFKFTLQFVHDTIDQPLRNAGITQTWGIAIMIFTAGK